MSEEVNDPVLSLATEEEIVTELARRNRGVVVGVVRDARNAQDQESFAFTYRGGFTLAIGIAQRAVARLSYLANFADGDVPRPMDEGDDDG